MKAPKGGSNAIAIGITDDEADEIWGGRFQATLTEVDDLSGALVVSGDYAMDYQIGDQLRVRDSSDNDGLYTVDARPEYDGTANETTISVEEALTTETVSGEPIVEPIWLRGGWQQVGSHLTGGTITRDRDVERIFDEADVEVAEVTNSDEVTIANGVTENDERFRLLLEWGEDQSFKARYFLPNKNDGSFFMSASGDLYADGRFFPNASFQKDSYEESTARDEQRSHGFTINATRPSAGEKPGFRKTVNLTAQEGWGTGEPDVSAYTDDEFTTSRVTQ